MAHFPETKLAELLPRATAWAEQKEQYIVRHHDAHSLESDDIAVARRAGVQHPERVRLLAVPEIPLPDEPDLKDAAQEVGLITRGTAGLTVGYGVFVQQDCLVGRLIAHELKHVAQFEECGSIAGFLRQYLAECNEYGYPNAPMEQEAIDFARKEYPSS
jgi:hypothetical protein